MKHSNQAILAYMNKRKEYHKDAQTGEINHTSLTEDAAYHFNAYEDTHDYAIPEWMFELALKVT
jgi:hypothetical protein